MVSALESFGASRSQLVDLALEAGPRLLPYLDLVRAPEEGRPPTVFEVQGQPRAYVFDGREGSEGLTRWIRRIAFRGDAEWVGVLRPGRLDVFRAALGTEAPQKLERLAQGLFLFPSLIHTQYPGDIPSVRAALLTLLRRSISNARAMGVGARDALSLVGRALFWRFLVDRRLLDGIDPANVSPGATTWESCLDNKTNALKTFAWLDNTFNGGLLAFSSPTVPSEIEPAIYENVVGNIAHGATADGQLELRLPEEWREVNFSHVPVGLLSEVYEAFAHDEYKGQAKAQSVFYTPRHIAEFVVDEALGALEGVARPRVLDPAAGAGVFLVTAFRALVAREWAQSGAKPPREVIRRILNDQLVGFDINDDALRLSELALYLTAIELDPEQRPRPLALLRFEKLRDRVLFLSKGQGSLGVVEALFREKFNLVIGNPPWTAKATIQDKKGWADATRDRVRERLGADRAAKFDFPDTNPDLPFVYRATEWAVPKGVIALVTHARWLFGQSERAISARRDLLESVHVTGLLNGTALRDTSVWPNVRHPFCLLFAINETPPEDATCQFISPELETTPDRRQQHMRIDWKDARDIEIAEIIKRPWSLKALFRGSTFDESIIDDIQRQGMALGQYLNSLGAKLCNGYQVGGEAGKQQSAKHLSKLPDLKGTQPSFFIDTKLLPKFSRPTLLFPRPRSIYNAPLLLIHESMRVDPAAPRASLAFEDLVFDERFDGISFADVHDGAKLAAYLQLVIQSSVFVHAALLLDGQYGVEREVIHKETIEKIPVVPWGDLSVSQRRTCAALSERLRGGITDKLLAEIDTFVADAIGLSDVQREAISDTLATALPTAAAKVNATRVTNTGERAEFARICEEEMVDLLSEKVLVRPSGAVSEGPWRFLQVDRADGTAATPDAISLDAQMFVEAADEGSASLVVIRAKQTTVLVGQLDQYRYWTRTRARLLASALVAEESDG